VSTPARRRALEHPVEFALGLFGEVRDGEAPTTLLLTLNVFLLLCAYYLLKVAREPLILLVPGGPELKSYLSVGQSFLFVFVASGYGWLASRLGRMALIRLVTLFFVVNLVVFWALGTRGAQLGVPFFLWVGIFNLTMVAQFWSFAADLFSEEQGKRLFAIIGIGSSVGAYVGARVADSLVFLGPFRLMLVAAALLLVCLGITTITNAREGARAPKAKHDGVEQEAPIGGENGFALVLRDRYLLLFAAVIFVLNWVTKTGDYVLDTQVRAAADALGSGGREYIGHFKAHYFEWVNGLGVLFQLFAVSRVVKYLGLRVALVIMPFASLVGYGAAFVAPILSVLVAARVAESSLDYSLSNTTRQALWLSTTRAAKYKAKQVIDTFVVRAGDVLSAALVWIGSTVHLSARGFLQANIVLSLAWLGFAVLLGNVYARRTAATTPVSVAREASTGAAAIAADTPQPIPSTQPPTV
jgi:AAA family ATP:ADP antiporter